MSLEDLVEVNEVRGEICVGLFGKKKESHPNLDNFVWLWWRSEILQQQRHSRWQEGRSYRNSKEMERKEGEEEVNKEEVEVEEEDKEISNNNNNKYNKDKIKKGIQEEEAIPKVRSLINFLSSC
jgi:hypothetical protein